MNSVLESAGPSALQARDMPKRLDHIALIVSDPERSARLFAAVFADAHVSPDDHGTCVELGGLSLELVAGEPPARRNGDHIALAVDAEELHDCTLRLQAQGIEVLPAREGRALYFSDYDNHVFELVLVAD